MKKFRSIKDLEKYFQSAGGRQALLAQSNIGRVLEREGQRLYQYLIEEMDKHYASYQPVLYHRTGAWIESVQLGRVKYEGDTASIAITFDDAFAYHPSVVENGDDGYVPILMEIGWKDTSFKTPHFEGFQGTQYIRKAVDRWNRNNTLGLSVRVFLDGKRYI